MISDALQDGSTIEQGICLHEGISGWRDEVNENLLFQADVEQVAGIYLFQFVWSSREIINRDWRTYAS